MEMNEGKLAEYITSKCYAYEQIIANSNFAPMIRKDEVE